MKNLNEIEIQHACCECHRNVGKEHFTSKDGRILCDDCSIGVEPIDTDLKRRIMELYKL